MTLVAGIDSSTQSCKVVVVDAETGRVVREGSARHPRGTECHPDAWWRALGLAVEAAGGLGDVVALSVAGQQHGMVLLDAQGEVIRPAQLWNDTRSASAATELMKELGPQTWAEVTGLSLVASFTVTKLRWMADNEPDNTDRISAICLPHDWLTWKLAGGGSLDMLVTDRSDASGTGYYDSSHAEYRRDLLAHALRLPRLVTDQITLPKVLAPQAVAGAATGIGLGSTLLGPGCGDNASAALGLALTPGQVSVSIGTSGVVAGVSESATHDDTGLVAGFADATGRYLPLTCTINGARVLDTAASVLGVDHEGLDRLALAAAPGAGGLVLVPHLDGERTPNLPSATGTLAGMTSSNLSRENYARAAIEGLLCLLAVGLDAQRQHGVRVDEVILTGGGAQSEAVRQLAPSFFAAPVRVPAAAEYVALGAARQAAWVVRGGAEPPTWPSASTQEYEGPAQPRVRDRYDAVARRLSRFPPL